MTKKKGTDTVNSTSNNNSGNGGGGNNDLDRPVPAAEATTNRKVLKAITDIVTTTMMDTIANNNTR